MKRMVEVEVPDANYDEWFNLLDNRISELERKTDLLLDGMSKIANVISRMSNGNFEIPPEPKVVVKYEPRDKWKERIRSLALDVKRDDARFGTMQSVMTYVYEYIRKNYGICWEQEQKEYKARDGVPGMPSIIDTANASEQLRSLVETVLMDLAENAKANAVEPEDLTLDDIIKPLIEKTHDTSKYNMISYRHVYKLMEDEYGVHWDNRCTRHANKTGKSPATRKEVIAASTSLKKKFERAVSDLLNETEN